MQEVVQSSVQLNCITVLWFYAFVWPSQTADSVLGCFFDSTICCTSLHQRSGGVEVQP